MSQTWRAPINAALILAFGAGVLQIGFYPAAFVYLIAHMLFLGVRPVWLPIAVAAGAVAVFYGVFDFALGVPVPRGSLF